MPNKSSSSAHDADSACWWAAFPRRRARELSAAPQRSPAPLISGGRRLFPLPRAFRSENTGINRAAGRRAHPPRIPGFTRAGKVWELSRWSRSAASVCRGVELLYCAAAVRVKENRARRNGGRKMGLPTVVMRAGACLDWERLGIRKGCVAN